MLHYLFIVFFISVYFKSLSLCIRVYNMYNIKRLAMFVTCLAHQEILVKLNFHLYSVIFGLSHSNKYGDECSKYWLDYLHDNNRTSCRHS